MKKTQYRNLSEYQHTPLPGTSSRVKAKEESESGTVFEFEKVKMFSEAHSPILSKQKREMIESKLALQRVAKISAAERLNSNQQFVRYNKNQFLDIGSQSYASQRQLDEFEEEEEDIVSAVNKIGIKQALPLNPQLKARREEYLKISSALGKVEKFVSMPQHKQSNQSSPTKKQISFDQIISNQEQKFTTYRQTNIFRAARNPKESLAIEELLSKSYFHFSGLSNHTSKMRVPIQSHLSSSSRKTLLRKDRAIQSKFDVLSPSQTNINLDEIVLDNLLGIASGRISTHLAFNSYHQSSTPETYEQSTTQTDTEDIVYRDNTYNKTVSFKDPNFQRDQIKNYLRLQVSKEEKKTFRKYDELAKMIKMELQTRNELVKQRINDRQLHQRLQGEINENISYLINLQENRDKTVDRLINRNKQHKDRNTSYRNKLIVSSLNEKKGYDAMLNDIISQGQK